MNDEISTDIVFLFEAILILTLVITAFFTVYKTVSYYELRSIIDKCNEDFGAGNWTFTESTDYYSCRSYSTIKNCYVNDMEVNCTW